MIPPSCSCVDGVTTHHFSQSLIAFSPDHTMALSAFRTQDMHKGEGDQPADQPASRTLGGSKTTQPSSRRVVGHTIIYIRWLRASSGCPSTHSMASITNSFWHVEQWIPPVSFCCTVSPKDRGDRAIHRIQCDSCEGSLAE